MREKGCEAIASNLASLVRDRLEVGADPIGVVLGTGWGDRLPLDDPRELSFSEISQFRKLRGLEGHARKFVAGVCADKNIIAISGRVHLNEEPPSDEFHRVVRLPIETLMQLGVKKVILTCAAGSLPNSGLGKGSLMVMDGFVTVLAPPMPLFCGEFCAPEDTLSPVLQDIARKHSADFSGVLRSGGYVMIRGPFFEGRKYDKKFLASTGAKAVGMSVLPEACICALYEGVEVLGLAFITNDDSETHSHEANLEAAHIASFGLSQFLTGVIGSL